MTFFIKIPINGPRLFLHSAWEESYSRHHAAQYRSEFLLNHMPDQQEYDCFGYLLSQVERLPFYCRGFDHQTAEMKLDYPVRRRWHEFLYSFHRDLYR